MKKRELKYVLILAGVFLLYVTMEVFGPKPIDWSITFHHKDKIPFGNYLLNERLQDIIGNYPVTHSYRTLAEISSEVSEGDTTTNHLILCQNLAFDKYDLNALLARVASGESAFISANHLWGKLADTLGVYTQDNLRIISSASEEILNDTLWLHFDKKLFSGEKKIPYLRTHVTQHLVMEDSIPHPYQVVAWNELHLPVTVYIPWGKGKIILNSTPQAFTNFYLLETPNDRFISGSLSLLGEGPLLWSEYYQMGRMEASTPLRFILRNESLRWAYYLSLVSLLVFIVFEVKRKQRIIPVVKPLENHSLQFVKTIGQLFLNRQKHKNLAGKKIQYFLERIRAKYYIKTDKIDAEFFRQLSRKSGKSKESIELLFRMIDRIQSARKVNEVQLLTLSKAIDDFENQEV
jgi:hypothetical protein